MPTALPIATDFTGSAITEAQFKTALTHQREFLAGLLGTSGAQVDALAALGAALSGIASKTAAYTVIIGDRGKLIDATSGTWTLSLTAAATLGANFVLAARNSGSGVITIDPAASEAIDGASTITLMPGESCLLLCTGTAWKTVGRVIPELPAQAGKAGQFLTTSGTVQSWGHAGEWILIADDVAIGAVSALDITWDETLYDGIKLIFRGVIPAVDGARILGRMGYSNGASFATGGDYNTDGAGIDATPNSTSWTIVGNYVDPITYGAGSAAGESANMTVTLEAIGAAVAGSCYSAYHNASGNANTVSALLGFYFPSTPAPRAWDTFRLYPSSGSFEATGSYTVYGRLK